MWNCCRNEYEADTEVNFFLSFLLQFVASMLETKIQLAALNYNIGYTTDCLYNFRDREKAEFWML